MFLNIYKMEVTIPKELGMYISEYHYLKYSYTRPTVILSNHKGKLQITNMTQICKAIGIEQEELRKWLSEYTGIKIDGEFYMNDIYTESELDELVEDFILENVLCSVCTTPVINSDFCNGCGANLTRDCIT
jgi:hypothetical protein